MCVCVCALCASPKSRILPSFDILVNLLRVRVRKSKRVCAFVCVFMCVCNVCLSKENDSNVHVPCAISQKLCVCVRAGACVHCSVPLCWWGGVKSNTERGNHCNGPHTHQIV